MHTEWKNEDPERKVYLSKSISQKEKKKIAQISRHCHHSSIKDYVCIILYASQSCNLNMHMVT